nr:MAG: major capsid protein [Microvirus sp.]
MFSTFNFTHFEQSIDTVTSVKPSIDSPVGSLEYATSLGYNYTPTGADLLFVIPYSRIKDNASLSSAFKTAINAKVQNNSNTSVVVAVSLNQYGRNLVTILKHLGINVNGFNSQPAVEETRKYVSLLPVFAFYKAYFDIFMPTRDLQWSSTNAHRILDWFNQTGKEVSDLYNNFSSTSYVSGKTFTSFLLDVASSYASVDPNYITQAVDKTTPSASVPSVVSDKMSGTQADSDPNSVLPAQYDTATSSNVISRVGLQLLTRLSKFVNTNTVIGRNVNAFLKAHFGAIGTSENSQYCGSSDVPINLGDVIVTANTELSQPGDFSGVGFGSGDYNFSYKANEFGYFIVLASIIPVSNYVQGEHYDNSITERFEFPSPEFDALGYDYLDSREIVPVPMALPYGFVRTSESTEKPVSTNFGYSPRYTGYKVHPSVYSGSFQIRSLRNSYLGFTLDNYITQDYVTQHGNHYYIEGPLDLTCGTRWRFVNKYPMFSNYERIFYNQRVNPFLTMDSLYDTTYSKNILAVPYEDNFVAYFDVKCSLVDHLKSISNSYDTLEGSDFYVNKQ